MIRGPGGGTRPSLGSFPSIAALTAFLLTVAAPGGTGRTAEGAEGRPAPDGAPGARGTADPPGCRIRGDREDLELRVSKLDSASVELEGGTVKLCYSRPRKLDRPVMGRLVPFGEPWRLGANEATAVHVPFPAEIAGVAVEPGWYSLYAVPGPDAWELVVNREAHRWGIPIDEEVREHDLGSGTVPVDSLGETTERLTIRLERATSDSAKMVISWERTRVRASIVRRPPEDVDVP